MAHMHGFREIKIRNFCSKLQKNYNPVAEIAVCKSFKIASNI